MAGFGYLIGKLIRSHSITHRGPDDKFTELLFADFNLLLVNDRIEEEVVLEGFAKIRIDLGAVGIIALAPLAFKVLFGLGRT